MRGAQCSEGGSPGARERTRTASARRQRRGGRAASADGSKGPRCSRKIAAMTEYLVKVGFWLRAYDSVTIEAGTAGEAIDKAKAAARILMQSRACPETIDTDGRRQGVIAYIDRVTPG